MEMELYNQYNVTDVTRKPFDGDAIVALLHESYDIDVNNMFTTPTSVVVNMDGHVINISSAIKDVGKKYMVRGRCVNNTITFRAITQ